MDKNAKKEKIYPEIRFPGFTDPWEQRKFADLYVLLTERNTELLPYNRTLSVATMTYKTDGNGAADSSLANYKRLRINDIAFEGHTSKEFRYGRFVLNDVGDGVMSPRFSALRPIVQMPTNFWKYYIHYEPIMRKVLVNSTKAGTMMNELVVDEFLKGSVLVPSKKEQARIGNMLANLDHLITLHQRKCEQIKTYKQITMQKIFKNMDMFALEKIGNYLESYSERNINDYEPVAVGKYGIRKRSEIYSGELAESYINNKVIGKNTLVIGLGSSQVDIGILFEDTNYSVSPAYPTYKIKNINPRYLNYVLQYLNGKISRKCMIIGARQGKTVNKEEFLNFEIPVTSLENQNKISDILSQLETRHKTEENLVNYLKTYKKWLLQKMFV